jgi:glutathione S-transferase
MILYGMRASPFVRKVIVYAAEKGIDLDVKPAGMGRGGPEFEAASPFRKMPGFVDGDFAISDSTAIITYLEALRPDPVLIPSDPRERARTIWFEEFGDTIVMAVGGKIFFNRVVAKLIGMEGDENVAVAAEQVELPPLLDYLERIIPESGFLVGDRFTLADIAVTSPFVNIGSCSDGICPDRFPRACAYLASMKSRPSFAAAIAEEQAQMAAVRSAA